MTNSTHSDRRDFLKTSALSGAAATLAAAAGSSAHVHAAGTETLRVGLVGCGGRGTGAANQALQADSRNRLVAMADVFPSQLEQSLKALRNVPEVAERVQVPPEQQFIGLDAYNKVIDAVDVVLLATPPGFRPYHLKAAVAADKHIFTEKPMATDVPGVRMVQEAVQEAKRKKLAMVAGFCWRYDYPRRELFQRIHDGAIGDVLSVYGTYLTGPVKPMPEPETRPEGITDLEWMVRNWYNFTWLSGDGLVEQACHTVDWLAWAKQDVPPISCVANGGRQIPQPGGNIFDHIEVNYVWDDGSRGFLSQRQIRNCHSENNLYVLGSKGQAQIKNGKVSISGETDWRYKGPKPNMYQVEHDEMFRSIYDGEPINDGERMVQSTLMAIMGRMSAYTGKQLTWEMANKSQQQLVPPLSDWADPIDAQPMAMPGITPFV